MRHGLELFHQFGCLRDYGFLMRLQVLAAEGCEVWNERVGAVGADAT